MVLRQRDEDSGWTSAADGTLEYRDYPMANWRGDVSLVVTAGAQVQEFVKYSAYGVPFAIPAGDSNCNGTNDSGENSDFLNAWGGHGWDARLDINTDGTVDLANDYNLRPFSSGGWGILSGFGNRLGYAGYQHAPELAGSKWHVRHRILDGELGRWTRRDPAGSGRDVDLYEYAADAPLGAVDPMGLYTKLCTGGACVATDPSDPSAPPDPFGCGSKPTKLDCHNCCFDNYPNPGIPQLSCLDICYLNFPPPPPDPNELPSTIQDCLTQLGNPAACSGAHTTWVSCIACCDRQKEITRQCIEQACTQGTRACMTLPPALMGPCLVAMAAQCNQAQRNLKAWKNLCLLGCDSLQM